jgi:predicted small lipoprotein YifL
MFKGDIIMSNRLRPLAIRATALLLLAILAGCGSAGPGETPAPAATTPPTATVQANSTATPAGSEPARVDSRSPALRQLTLSWNTDWTRATIDLSEILSGGPPRDGIPSIDRPEFVAIDEAREWVAGNEPVIALEIDGDARAYPLQILTWHEIVNDTLGDAPVLVTFCPLCNSAIVFDRRVDGETYDFGASGLLRNSDLVMYDRTTESLWQQLTGEAIVGEKAGHMLTFLSSALVSLDDFEAAYPQGQVLSRETGYDRPYGRNPYAGYDSVSQTPFLFDGELDGRLRPMERVVAVTIEDQDIAYPYRVLREVGVINHAFAGRRLAVFYQPGASSALDTPEIAEGADVGAAGVFDATLNGQPLTFRYEGERIIDEETGSAWNVLGQSTAGPLSGSRLTPVVHANHFWFAWAAFKPETIIFDNAP